MRANYRRRRCEYRPSRRRELLAKFRVVANIAAQKHEEDPIARLRHMFAEGTTGLERVMDARDNWFRFSIWLTSYVFLIGCMAFFVHNVFAKYSRFTTASSFGLNEPQRCKVPAVTICNLNYLRKSTFCIDPSFPADVRYSLCNEDQSRQDVFAKLSYGVLRMDGNRTSVTREDVFKAISKHTIPWESSVLKCFLGGKNCRSSEFIGVKGTVNSEYGLCYTLFDKKEIKPGDQFNESSKAEFLEIHHDDYPSDGLHLVLDAHNDEYLPFLVEEGFFVLIHRPMDEADVSRDGILVPTNRATFVALHRKVALLLEPPYDTQCQDDVSWPEAIVNSNPFVENAIHGKPYSVASCEYICRAVNLIEVCECEAGTGNLEYALLCLERIYRENNFTCKSEFTQNPLATAEKYRKKTKCACPKRCREVMYMKQVSYASILSSVADDSSSSATRRTRERLDLRRRLAEVFVYFKERKEDTINVKATYTWAMMLNEVGGFMGSFVGMAFMSIFEIVENLYVSTLNPYVSRGLELLFNHRFLQTQREK